MNLIFKKEFMMQELTRNEASQVTGGLVSPSYPPSLLDWLEKLPIIIIKKPRILPGPGIPLPEPIPKPELM
ncbi:hypothetical protein BWD09_08130 [Neisseria dentiae]|uniref:Uncharacterized protein n=1 Tax=Neisseria dentiae TaxID=194197 RepID=A0A1X3D7S5_9NEIS|nr:hypothetical protein [Neisseria dentiae]OSI15950.1 hypothetical protein BWD09_08130 [Neisseria dentiae]QMT45348.1 hypothetical protein H3L92_00355 [Neisseria dentiae]